MAWSDSQEKEDQTHEEKELQSYYIDVVVMGGSKGWKILWAIIDEYLTKVHFPKKDAHTTQNREFKTSVKNNSSHK